MKCNHHRQRAGGDVLPCAQPGCAESIPVANLLVNSESGPLFFERFRTKGMGRGRYVWREAPLPFRESA